MLAVIIDSGISENYKSSQIVGGISIFEGENGYIIKEDFNDTAGHGTGVVDTFLKYSKQSNVYMIKVCENEFSLDIDKLYYALKYVYDNINCDIIQISAGSLYHNVKLNNIINLLEQRGIIVVAAFNNEGAISYPAAYENVIGVDISSKYNNINEFEIMMNGIIDIKIADVYFRIAWSNPKHLILKGSSFSTSYISALILNCCNKEELRSKKSILEKLKKYAQKVVYTKNNFHNSKNKFDLNSVKKAIVLPFNKEIHSIANFEDMLSFEIIDYYDYKQGLKIGAPISKVLPHTNNNHIIKNIEEIDWVQDFDTVICGHLTEYSNLLGLDCMYKILKLCKKYNKNVYAFDNIEKEAKKLDLNNYFYPKVTTEDVPQCRFGKLRISNKPLLAVLGTSSQQGKFTVQLNIRKRLKEKGYKVGGIGTEPSSLLFGIDEVFPFGYNSTVDINSHNMVMLLNEMVWNIEKKGVDIIISGGQSGILNYSSVNISQYPIMQNNFLLGIKPDTIVLCINLFDEIEHIDRTIKFVENYLDSKVVSLVLSPNTSRIKKSKMSNKNYDILKFKTILKNRFNIGVYEVLEEDMDKMVDEIISYY